MPAVGGDAKPPLAAGSDTFAERTRQHGG
jgi:hypothetical protein